MPLLSELRQQIDGLDAQIQALMTERAKLAQAVAQAKLAEESNPTFYRPEREAQVLRKVAERNTGPLSDDTLMLLFREIMSACLALQRPLSVAFLGPAGTYSQAAARKQFGNAIQATMLQTIDEVFREVEAESVDYGIVPVENSTEGGVTQTLNNLISTSVKICGEVELPIHHCLLSKIENVQNIQRIYAHHQALAQCHVWLTNYAPQAKCVPVSSNAEAARLAATEANTAAIASEMAAQIYDLVPLASRIEDSVNNTTRFVVLGRHDIPATGHDKTSLLLSPIHAQYSGSLYRLIKPFSDLKINMTRIESRPSPQAMWEYLFFIDIEGHVSDAEIQRVLQTLQENSAFLKHLGSYPRAVR